MIDNSCAVPVAGFFARRINNMLGVAPAHDWLFMLHFLVRRMNQAVQVAPLQDWHGVVGVCARRTTYCLQHASVEDWMALLRHQFSAVLDIFNNLQTLMICGSVVSESRKAIFWLLPRTGSRAIGCVINHMGFVDTTTNIPLKECHTHAIGIPKGCEKYHITALVRNPYSWVLSCWHLWGNGMTFKEYLNTQGMMIPFNALKRTGYYREPDAWVKYETMDDDMMAIDYIRNDPTAVGIIQSLRNNTYTLEDAQGVLARDPKNPRYTDYLSYYDQADLDKVYHIYEKYFKKFGYPREFKPV